MGLEVESLRKVSISLEERISQEFGLDSGPREAHPQQAALSQMSQKDHQL